MGIERETGEHVEREDMYGYRDGPGGGRKRFPPTGWNEWDAALDRADSERDEK